MAVDKVLLRKAICDGAFGNIMNGAPAGQAPHMRPIVTPEVLEKVSQMSDEVINATLTIYKANKKVQLEKIIADSSSKLAEVQSQLSIFNQ